jgi:hypothetical protein
VAALVIQQRGAIVPREQTAQLKAALRG